MNRLLRVEVPAGERVDFYMMKGEWATMLNSVNVYDITAEGGSLAISVTGFDGTSEEKQSTPRLIDDGVTYESITLTNSGSTPVIGIIEQLAAECKGGDGGGGTNVHNELDGRFDTMCHLTSSIAGLDDILAGKASINSSGKTYASEIYMAGQSTKSFSANEVIDLTEEAKNFNEREIGIPYSFFKTVNGQNVIEFPAGEFGGYNINVSYSADVIGNNYGVALGMFGSLDGVTWDQPLAGSLTTKHYGTDLTNMGQENLNISSNFITAGGNPSSNGYKLLLEVSDSVVNATNLHITIKRG